MKRILGILAIIFSLLPIQASALNLGSDIAGQAATQAGYSRGTTQTTLSETLGTIVKSALSLVGVIFLLLMVYAGFLWLNAKGNEDQINKAQDIIRSSIIGLIITVGAYSITAFIVPRIISRATGGSSGTVGATDPNASGPCHWSDIGSLHSGDSTQTQSTCRSWCDNTAAAFNESPNICTFNGNPL